MYVGDVAHPKALDLSKSMDLIWAIDFHLSEGGLWRVVI